MGLQLQLDISEKDLPHITILAPAAFSSVLTTLAQAFEDTGEGSVQFVFGPATGDSPDAITNRVPQPEGAHGVFLPMELMAKVNAAGHLRSGSPREVFVTRIAAAVAAKAAIPDLSTLDAIDGHLGSTETIGLSMAASGKFLRNTLFPSLPNGAAIVARIEEISGSVGEAVRDKKVSVGFQQYSELVAVEGLQVITAIAPEARNDTTIGFAALVGAPSGTAVDTFASFLASSIAAGIIAKFGLSPAT